MVRHEANAARTFRWGVCCLPVVCVLAAAGCNNSRQVQTDLVHRQLRLQEDEIYRLEDYLEEYQALVQGYRSEVADLERQLAAAEGTPPSLQPTPTPAPADPDPSPAEADQTLPEIEMPTLEVPEAEAPEPVLPTPAVDAAGEAPPFDAGVQREERDRVELARAIGPVEPPESPPAPFAPDPHAIAKPISPVTGVDETLSLAVEPGGEQGELVVRVTDTLGVSQGRVSVMLTEPTADERPQRIARWDYTNEETTDALQVTATGETRLDLLIALPDDAPRGRPLRLWVRWLDGESRRLQATHLELNAEGHPIGYATTQPPAPEVISLAPPNPATATDAWRPARRADRAIVTASYAEPVQ